MQRRQFIKTSAMTGGALVACPLIFGTAGTGMDTTIFELKETIHIRHGFYSSENPNGVPSSPGFGSIQIDRFLHPEGDLLLFDLRNDGVSMRIGLTNDDLLLTLHDRITAFKIRSGLNLPFPGQELRTMNEDEVRTIDKPALLLEGHLSVDDRFVRSPAVIYPGEKPVKLHCRHRSVVIFRA